jgi:expansin (peptidoglycan-binding protein)
VSQGTYYGDNGAYGTCSFSNSDAQYLPWAAGTSFRVAMDSPLFFNSQTCGMCIAMRGTGPGSGGISSHNLHDTEMERYLVVKRTSSIAVEVYRSSTCQDIKMHLSVAGDPIPLTTQYVLVSNLCPECKSGDLDQEKAGDGRWEIEWYPVQCAVGNTPFVYSFQGSNPYYIKMQISNHRHAHPCCSQLLPCMLLHNQWPHCQPKSRHQMNHECMGVAHGRVPVLSVQWFFSGTWYDMNRVGDNYFVIQAINDQALILPAQVKITSIFGDTVIDTVATSSPTVSPQINSTPNHSFGIKCRMLPSGKLVYCRLNFLDTVSLHPVLHVMQYI